MDFFNKIKGTINNAGDSFKMNSQIRENEKQIQNLIYQIGVQCFNNHGNETGTEYDRLFSQIHSLQSENKRLQDSLSQLNAGVVCQKCGTENPQGSAFCSNCGAPLNVVNVDEQPEICPGCGAKNEPGTKFCTNCGAPLPQSGDSQS